MKVDDKRVKTDALQNYIKQKPNKKILYLFRFHLWVYNIANTGKKWKWKKKIGEIVGEKPVVLDDYYTKKSARQIGIYLKNKGYYHAKVKDSVIYYTNKTADVIYVVAAGKPYTVRNIDYTIEDTEIRNIILNDSANSVIRRGVHFDVDKMQEERARMARLLNTKGYFYFVKEFIDYQVDSTLKSNQVDINLRLKNPQKIISETEFVPDKHRKQKIKNIYIIPNYDQKKALQETETYFKNFDTLADNGFYFVYEKKMPIKPATVLRNIYLKSGDYYNISEVDKSYKFLSGLKIYKLINIQFVETADTTSAGEEYMDCVIQLTPFTVQSYTFEVVGTNSSSDIGMGGNFIYQHKNLFRGAEILDLKVNAELQMLKNVVQESTAKNKIFNTTEIGGEAKLYIPKFLLPYKSEILSRKYEAKTTFTIAENYQNRPDYTRTITSGTFGYFWKTSEYIKHFLNPIDISSIHLYDTVGFKYPDYLRASYDDFLITAINYSFVFNNQKISKSKDFTFFSATIETAGNMPGLYYSSTNAAKDGEYYKMLNVRYAQYLKSDIDYRFYHFFSTKNNLASRVFLGLGFPYGNSNELPFVKQYFCGGANSLRAWSVRSLGPGTYRDTTSTYNFQSADLKLEANFEYRFDIFWMFKGALFADVGNIWFMYKSDLGAEAKFKLDRFYKDLALGTGLGIRMDLSMFIFRCDFGLKIRNPNEIESRRWILFSKKFDLMGDFLQNVNIGIGYPF
ncbi:MAG: BamA/TamA family outer membrane protein [Bacteroidia bacterium]|nr:BamA/TamA family outer membrane protein [Bacteroidia bacterium]